MLGVRFGQIHVISPRRWGLYQEEALVLAKKVACEPGQTVCANFLPLVQADLKDPALNHRDTFHMEKQGDGSRVFLTDTETPDLAAFRGFRARYADDVRGRSSAKVSRSEETNVPRLPRDAYAHEGWDLLLWFDTFVTEQAAEARLHFLD